MWEQTSRVAEEVSIIYMYSSGFLNKGKMDKKEREECKQREGKEGECFESDLIRPNCFICMLIDGTDLLI
jgi:hypothetical protein